jgi:DNA adenine methylase
MNTCGGALKTFFVRQGGKHFQRDTILSYFPSVDNYDTYVEPFLGAGNILINAPTVKYMYAGDTDSRVIDMFKGIKKITVKDIENYDFTPNKSKFLKIRDSPLPKDIKDRFLALLYLIQNSFFGLQKSYRGKDRQYTGQSLIKNLGEIREKLEHIKVFHKDYKYIIDKYDSPTTFFYLDPPYYNTSSQSYETGEIDHEELKNKLDKIKGMFLLSYNNCPYIRKLYKGYIIHKIKTRQIGKKGGSRELTELLICNYKLT